MTELKQIYKCEVCGNITEVIHTGIGNLVCCGKSMVHKEEQTEGEYAEKHAPIITKNKEGVNIKVGKIEHPMAKEHYIEWIEISTEHAYSRKFLKPGMKPEINFPVKADIKKARMYCNVHGLWRNK